jgi:hypothetical protein
VRQTAEAVVELRPKSIQIVCSELVDSD